MFNSLIVPNLPYAVALLLILFVMLRRKARRARRMRASAAQRREVSRKLFMLDDRYDGETADYEEFTKRLERQRQLVERYNRERGGG